MDTLQSDAVFILAPDHGLGIAYSRRRGVTLIELLVLVLLLVGIIAGAGFGADLGAPHGAWMKAAAAVLGAVAGGIGVVVFLFLLVLPLCVVDAVRRAMEPADLACRCREPGRTVPEPLVPHTPIEFQALEDSRRLAEWSEYARLGSIQPVTVDHLRARLSNGSLSAERIALAAQLGDPFAKALAVIVVEPVLHYPDWARLPKDVHAVLRSGLPPRLCIVWALACADRVLPTFETEFHEDTRPRQIVGAALMVVRDGDAAAAELCRSLNRTWWNPREAGCRVLRRDLLTRIRGCRSKGQHAAEAAWNLARAVSDFGEPCRLWAVYSPGDMAGAYETPQMRCECSQPAFNAEHVASAASLAATDADAERRWQRAELARMILDWDRWDEDREAWRIRVEEEWIPLVRGRVKGMRFDVPAYLERIRREWIPWRS